MSADYVVDDDHRDDEVDQVIRDCLNQSNPKSFFLFAGAGSGKTKSLIDALNFIQQEYGEQFMTLRRSVAVITYTNAACDEIKRRLQYNPLFQITTIHSFAWTLIQHYTKDIKIFLATDLSKRIEENEAKQVTGRKGSQAYRDRERKISAYRERIERLSKIKKFIYNPERMNTEKNSLDHDEVLRICANFLTTKHTFRDVVVDRFPVLLIDESQDTKKDLLDAFLTLEESHRDHFCMGLMGDVMQRIYLDGKERIQDNIQPWWKNPCKKMNHRSRKRIVDLCNDIRKQVDGIEQIPRHDKQGGVVRVFLVNRTSDRIISEKTIQEKMSAYTGNQKWLEFESNKYLTLEHHMAARRLGFDDFFIPLYRIYDYRQGVSDGSLSVLSPLSKIIVPLFQAFQENNRFAITQIVKHHSPMVRDGVKNRCFSSANLTKLNDGIAKLLKLWHDGNDPKCVEILNTISQEVLFDLPNDICILLSRSLDDTESDKEEQEGLSEKIDALEEAMQAPFSHFVQYHKYVSGNASFDTHQGVKGLQFERVMVIIDDEEAQGSTFSYGKLLGLTEMSERDISNERQGKETTIDRTRRLLYVTCSRAIDSLALVFYVDNIATAREKFIECGWFFKEEIESLQAD